MAGRLPNTAAWRPFPRLWPGGLCGTRSGVVFEVHGTAKDPEGERSLAEQGECQFLYWAVSQAGLTCDQEGYRRAATF